jgi:hypothetical protein
MSDHESKKFDEKPNDLGKLHGSLVMQVDMHERGPATRIRTTEAVSDVMLFEALVSGSVSLEESAHDLARKLFDEEELSDDRVTELVLYAREMRKAVNDGRIALDEDEVTPVSRTIIADEDV